MGGSCAVPAVVITIVIVLLLCCCCLMVAGFGVIGGISQPVTPYDFDEWFPNEGSNHWGQATSTPLVVRPTPENTATGEPGVMLTPPVMPRAGNGVWSSLQALTEAQVPENDLRDLARRLKGVQNIPLTVEPQTMPLQVGTRKQFWVSNVDTNQNFQVTATLQYVTDHLYFWVEDGISYKKKDLERLAETFEEKIYPTNREFFGSEWSPGIDGDPHLYILYARGLGYSLAGYFSSIDSVHPLAHEYSNAHEMFCLNADNVYLGDTFTYAVLAHEFQHMIHWYRDRNEETWLNEGFSELAAFLNDYDVGGFDYLYVSDPDMQLTFWPSGDGSEPYYGAAFLFVTYFLDRFGEQATRALVAEAENGMTSIDKVLEQIGAIDAVNGNLISADDLFLDWTITNYLLDGKIGDGRYVYHNYPYAPQAGDTEVISYCPKEYTGDVSQYGVDYLRIDCSGDYRLTFEGSTQVKILPTDAYSGKYAFWSNRGDESDMTLTRRFDFREASAPLTLSYWTWYDLEEDYDYAYVEASTDGERWQILTTPSGTAKNPSGNSYGWGYNGLSGFGPQWIQEEVDISEYAGQEVWLRFEYVTDAAVNGEGLILDDISIPQIGYLADFESGDDGWEGAGFVRIDNLLPQRYRLALISVGKKTTVQYLPLTADNTLEISLQVDRDVDHVVLVVTGTTRFTWQKTAYRVIIE